MTTEISVHPLDDPVRSSLRGAHAKFATWSGQIARYDSEVAGFVGHPPDPAAQDFADLASLVGPSTEVALRGAFAPPPGWDTVGAFDSVQLDGSALEVEQDSETVVLGPEHVPAVLDLVERTKPGPFRPRTIEMGTYLGLFDGDALVSLAGERMHPQGWTEISAVCTDPDYRRRGLSARLVRAVGHGIRERGEIPFLHARADNYSAIAMYESLGFVLRKRSVLTLVRTPGS
ncbi:hypothetical protein GCM10007304_04860 [Rhodococcoides trifolii]|uniref:N-acetyltransferase domain-containing protein n=1 Tax=Rhodococcoides trifolii TaxID=908250 RepID=A0A917FN89_9NOCA|nr:GNAT family N-acetyltransferase [Rhodococcus trifolii]GGF94064.1 hypothetical protein GCM10007304_04860 [Rhodococcus trifolii]